MKYQENEKKDRFRSRFLIGVAIVLGIVVVISAGVLINIGIKNNRYNVAIKGANYYFTQGNYQSAIVGYESAIKIDEKKVLI